MGSAGCRLRAAVLSVAVAVAAAQGEQLAVRTFTVADGLAGDWINALLQDSRGYLWIGTCTGLSRFDGAFFTSYTTLDGLPHPAVSAVAEDHTGSLWIGTSGGLVRLREFRDAHGRLFEPFELPGARAVNAVFEDSRQVLWVAAGEYLFRLQRREEEERFVLEDVPFRWLSDRTRAVMSLAEGRDGSLWVGTAVELMRRWPDGRWARYVIGSPNDPVRSAMAVGSIAVDHQGRVWLAGSEVLAYCPETDANTKSGAGIRHVAAADGGRLPALPEAAGTAVAWGISAGLPRGAYGQMGVDRDGTVWAPNLLGLFVFPGGRASVYTHASGLAEDWTTSVVEDNEGNLWVGTGSCGLMRVDRIGFTKFGADDGLIERRVAAVSPDTSGGVYLIGGRTVHHVTDGRLEAVSWRLPRDVKYFGWGTNQVTLCDSKGEWWVPTGEGLFRFAAVSRFSDLAACEPVARYGTREGMGGSEAFRIFEDSRGDLWLGVFGAGVVRWERKTGTFHQLGAAVGDTAWAASAFAEDRTGAVWVGLYRGGLARCRGGRCDRFPPGGDLPRGFVWALLVDHIGRLWVGTDQGGLLRTDDPTAPTPFWHHYTTADGLASDGILALTEDRFGNIYAGSRRGVDRLEPATGRVAHFDTSSGLVNNNIQGACTDRNGDVWFATPAGASRLHPRAATSTTRPRLVILEVRSGGHVLPVPELGAARLGPWRLASGADSLEVAYAGITFIAGQQLRFQHAVGVPIRWSEPVAERRLHLAGLSPGRYELHLRAVRSDGATSNVSTVAFTIPSPVWMRWWFIGGMLALIIGGTVASYRVRVRRLNELARVRSSIAADLHDELGLSLSRIAILSEVASQKLGPNDAADELATIGTTARDLIAASSDMAWSLDARHDDLASLLARLRRLAEDVLTASGIRWSFSASPTVERLSLGAEQRRHVFLILKEAINNAARHAGATAVRLSVEVNSEGLRAEVSDNGCGFDISTTARSDSSSAGRGLAGMARRAHELDGRVVVTSSPGTGTVVRLEVPLASR